MIQNLPSVVHQRFFQLTGLDLNWILDAGQYFDVIPEVNHHPQLLDKRLLLDGNPRQGLPKLCHPQEWKIYQHFERYENLQYNNI